MSIKIIADTIDSYEELVYFCGADADLNGDNVEEYTKDEALVCGMTTAEWIVQKV